MYIRTPQEEGTAFENEIHQLLSTTKLKVLREIDVVNKYGKTNKGIDHLLYDDNNNVIICIQTKFTSSKPQLQQINHFIQCVENISLIDNKKCIGIYLTKLPLTATAYEAFINKNKKYDNYYLQITIDNKYEYENNINKKYILQYNLREYLYIYLHIYCYDYDDCIIMNY